MTDVEDQMNGVGSASADAFLRIRRDASAEALIFPHIFSRGVNCAGCLVFVKGGRHGGRRDRRLGGGSFGGAGLGDRRRPRRLVRVAAAFRRGACCGGGGSISSVIADAHQAKAAYRLLDCPGVTPDAVLSGHVRHVRDALRREAAGPGGATCLLLIEDTTALEYHGLRRAAGLGPIGESYTRGFWLHSTLTARWDEAADRCRVLGLVGQRAWARPPERPRRRRRKGKGRGKESTHARQGRAGRESARWASVLSELPRREEGSGGVIYVADRESDIYEVFQTCRSSGCSQVIRSAYPRALAA